MPNAKSQAYLRPVPSPGLLCDVEALENHANGIRAKLAIWSAGLISRYPDRPDREAYGDRPMELVNSASDKAESLTRTLETVQAALGEAHKALDHAVRLSLPRTQ